jgi:hypothetical protein
MAPNRGKQVMRLLVSALLLLPLAAFPSASPKRLSPYQPLDRPGEPRAVDFYDWSDRLVPYQQAWDLQRALLERRLLHPEAQDTAILLQHPPTYTLGTGSTPDNLLFDSQGPDAPCQVFRVERGGEVTFHGPGQVRARDACTVSRHSFRMQIGSMVYCMVAGSAAASEAVLEQCCLHPGTLPYVEPSPFYLLDDRRFK